MTRRSGALLVLAAGVVFSFGALFFRATDDVDAWQYLAFRGAGAVGVVGPLVVWRNRGDLGAIRRRLPWQHAVAGTVLGTLMISFIVSLSRADAAFVLLFQALAPITAAIAEERRFLAPGQKVAWLGIGSGLVCSMLAWEW